jgi:hypothetical protein
MKLVSTHSLSSPPPSSTQHPPPPHTHTRGVPWKDTASTDAQSVNNKGQSAGQPPPCCVRGVAVWCGCVVLVLRCVTLCCPPPLSLALTPRHGLAGKTVRMAMAFGYIGDTHIHTVLTTAYHATLTHSELAATHLVWPHTQHPPLSLELVATLAHTPLAPTTCRSRTNQCTLDTTDGG